LPEAHVAMGSFYYHAGQFDRALEEFDIARKQTPNSSDLLAEIAYCYRRQGKMEQAVEELTRAITLDPRSGIKLQILGDTYLRLRRYAHAERYFDLALEIVPDLDVLYVTKAWLHVMRDGDIETAREIMQAMYEFAKITPFSSHWSALLDLAVGHYDGALKKYSVDDPASPGENHYARAYVYGLQGKSGLERLYYDSARAVLEEGVSANPGDPRYHAGLAITYAGLDRRNEAMHEAARTFELAPLAADVIYNRFLVTNAAIAYVRIGEADSAISLLEELVSLPCLITPASIRVSPFWAPLRDHPRFQTLLENDGDNDET
ncbi:MAG: tetratricopeptide repeat protein, partial [Candidatus Zixiibacteriota bacterium]